MHDCAGPPAPEANASAFMRLLYDVQLHAMMCDLCLSEGELNRALVNRLHFSTI